jgi:putative transcriptional regulator
MVISHNDTGTVALCLNGDETLETQDIDEECGPWDYMAQSYPIHWGGPVAKDSIWMLHDDLWSSTNTVEIGTGTAISSDIEMLESLKAGDTPKAFRVMNGFCSWAPGQLAAELEGLGHRDQRHAWLVAPCPDLETLLDCDIEDLWEEATALSAQSAVDRWLN